MINDGGARDLDDAAARDLDDAAAVLTVLTILTAGAAEPPDSDRPAALWGDPARRLGVELAGKRTWWASGLSR